MAGRVRSQMIEGAERLLSQRGLQATSFATVLELTGAPRGSVYHHFPGGKDEMVAAALDLSGRRMSELLAAKKGAPAVEIARYFLYIWREVLSRSEFRAGCSITAVTVATESTVLREHAAGIFRASRDQLTELLVAGGLDPGVAPGFATLLVSSAEGAVVLCRAEASLEPLEQVTVHLLEELDRRSGV